MNMDDLPYVVWCRLIDTKTVTRWHKLRSYRDSKAAEKDRRDGMENTLKYNTFLTYAMCKKDDYPSDDLVEIHTKCHVGVDD